MLDSFAFFADKDKHTPMKVRLSTNLATTSHKYFILTSLTVDSVFVLDSLEIFIMIGLSLPFVWFQPNEDTLQKLELFGKSSLQ